MENDNKENKALSQTSVSGSYFDNVLIKLRRKYSKDEAVSALSKKLQEVEIELGKAISYIHELEDEKKQTSFKNGGKKWYDKYKKIKERFHHLDEKAKKDELYLMRTQENSKLHSELRKVRKENKELVNRIYLLENASNL
jgi:hypothetical protein